VNTTFWRVIALPLFAALGYVALVAIPERAIHPQPSELTADPSSVGLAFEDFVISPADQPLQLKGWVMPASQPRAVLVFIHGGGSNRTSSFFGSLNFYRAMVGQGLSVVAIDLRNHGASGSDGRGLQFGRTEKFDARAAIDWARRRYPGLPAFAMGISMGGATLIQAAHDGAKLNGLILLDSVLDSRDTFKQGAWVQTGLPPAVFALSAWAATAFHGLPSGGEQALQRATMLKLPILAMQDPGDPVARARYSRELAQRNHHVTLWLAPTIDPAHPDLAFKERWGTHVAAFQFFPQDTVAQIIAFINAHSH
jgi:pimeloyl-ACP methyl ester carboxylesterase